MYKLVITDNDNKVILEEYSTSHNNALTAAEKYSKKDRAADRAYVMAYQASNLTSISPYQLIYGEIVEL